MPPADAIAVATAPTTPWSGTVCRRIVMEYDDGGADMLLTLAATLEAPSTDPRPGQHATEQHQSESLRDDDGADQRASMRVVQPPGEAASGQARARLERRERAVRRGEPGTGDEVGDERLHRGV